MRKKMKKGNIRIYILATVILILVIVTYSNHFHNSFLFDDIHTIVFNPYIRDISNIPLFFRDATTFSNLWTNQSYRPLLSATLAIDYFLGNGTESTFMFHLHTFIFFILQGFLMYFLFLNIFNYVEKNPTNRYIALLSIAWYMLHPANADTINYIIQRGESLSTFCIILAFVLFIYSPFARKWCLYLIPFAVGAFAKPMAGIFAPLFFMYLLLFEKRSWKHFLKTALPAFIFVSAVMLFIQRMELPTWAPGGAFFNYVITQPYVILLYFATFFLPIRLSVDTDLYPFTTMADIRFFGGTVFLILLITAAIVSLRYKNFRPLAFGIFWFLIALLPTSLIPLSEVMNSHRMFLPFVGLTLGISWTISLGIRKLASISKPPNTVMRPVAALIAITLLIYAYGTHQRNKVWKSTETFWRDITVKSPNNGRAMMTYGAALMEREDYEGAELYLRRAFELTPDSPRLHALMAVFYDNIVNPEQAEKYYLSAIEHGPLLSETFFFYARFLHSYGRFDEAEENLIETIRQNPAHLDARHLLMDVYYEKWDFRNLASIAEDTLRIVPNDEWAIYFLDLASSISPERLIRLSSGYYQSGDYKRSIEAALEALKLRPDFILAYINISAAYAMLEEWDKAVEAGEYAVALNPNNQRAIQNLNFARSRQAASGGQTQ